MAFSGSLLCAAPQGGQVRAGQAQITQQGKVTNINQSSQKAAINWQKFNIAADETVNFKQPNAHSVTLNRVIGNEKSVINGAMNANGKVFLLNPHGTLIGKGAKINVGGLVASTANISDDDFMQGKYRFTGNGSGAVENYGEIVVPNGGVVALIAPIVKNNGNIKADSASVLLASAEHFSITLPENGDFAYTIDKGTLQGLVDNGGAVLADGGVVILTAAGLDSVKKSVVRHTGIIQANTVANKNGKILLLGDLDNSRTEVSGSLKAEAPISGDGGFIETSANQVQIDDSAFVSTKATNGKTGEWLIDPTDYTVAASGGDMTGAAVSNALQNNNLTLKSTNGKADGKGDVVINDTINWNKNTLILNAQNDIHINKTINGSGSAKLALQYGQASADGGESNYYLDKDVRVNLPVGQNLSTQKGKSGEVVEFEVIHKMPEIVKNSDGNYESKFTSENIAIGKDIDLSYTKNYQNFAGWHSPRYEQNIAGLGHHINNLNLNSDSLDGIGFIIKANTVDIKNLHLNQVSTISTGPGGGIGGLVGRLGDPNSNSNSFIDDVSVSGQVGNTIHLGNTYGGLVGYSLSGLKINNSHFSGSVTGGYYIGGLVGGVAGDNSSITNSYTTGKVNGISDVGGLVGGIAGNNSSIANSYSTSNVTGIEEDVGGLAGVIAGVVVDSFSPHQGFNISQAASTPATIENSYATGIVSGQENIGGLVGDAFNAKISKSYATGAVSGVRDVGGLTGSAEDSKINQSYATGSVSASGLPAPDGSDAIISDAGGLVGSIDESEINQSYATGSVSGGSGVNVAGLAGFAKNSKINRSYSSSNINGTARVGGLVGEAQNITIENAYATGTLTHKDNSNTSYDNYNGQNLIYFGGLVGGLAEYHDGETDTKTKTTINNAYFSGSINANDNATTAKGAVVGGNLDPNIQFVTENVYYDDKGGEQDGGSANGIDYGTPLTPAQMKKQSSFKGFDFNSIWEIKEGQSTPTLRWEKDTATGKYVLKIKIGNAEVVYGDDRLGSSLTYPEYFTPSDGLSLFNYGYTYEGLQDNDDIKQVLANNGHLIFIGEWTTAKNVKKSGDNIVGYTVDIERPTIAKQFADKYDIQWETGTLTVTPKFVSVSGSKVYDGTSTVKLNKYRLDEKQLVNGDKNLTVSGTANVGTYTDPYGSNPKFNPQVNAGSAYNSVPYALKGSLTAYNPDGSVNHNYMIDGVNSRWTITKKTINLTGKVADKNKNHVTAQNVALPSNWERLGGVAQDKNKVNLVGSGSLNDDGYLSSSSFALTGEKASNYTLNTKGKWTIVNGSSQGGSTGGSGSGAGTGGSAGGNGSTGGSVKPNKPTQTQTTPNPTTQVNNENTSQKLDEPHKQTQGNKVPNPTVDYDNGSGTVSSGNTTSSNGSVGVNCSGNSCAPYAYDPSKVDLTPAFAVSEEEEPAKKPYGPEQQTKPQGGSGGSGQDTLQAVHQVNGRDEIIKFLLNPNSTGFIELPASEISALNSVFNKEKKELQEKITELEEDLEDISRDMTVLSDYYLDLDAPSVHHMVDISAFVYQDEGAPEGWERVIDTNDPNFEFHQESGETGLYGAVFRHKLSGQYVLAFRGTELSDWEDIKTDMHQATAFKNLDTQFEYADKFFDFLENTGFPVRTHHFYLTGHSLGGGLAKFVGSANGITTMTFNASNIHNVAQKYITAKQSERPTAEAKVYQIQYKGEFLTWVDPIKDHIGTENQIGAGWQDVKSKHAIATMQDFVYNIDRYKQELENKLQESRNKLDSIQTGSKNLKEKVIVKK